MPASILVAVLSHLPRLRALRLKGAPSAAILEILTFLPLLEKWKESPGATRFAPQIVNTASMNAWTKDPATAGWSYPYMYSKAAIAQAWMDSLRKVPDVRELAVEGRGLELLPEALGAIDPWQQPPHIVIGGCSRALDNKDGDFCSQPKFLPALQRLFVFGAVAVWKHTYILTLYRDALKKREMATGHSLQEFIFNVGGPRRGGYRSGG